MPMSPLREPAHVDRSRLIIPPDSCFKTISSINGKGFGNPPRVDMVVSDQELRDKYCFRLVNPDNDGYGVGPSSATDDIWEIPGYSHKDIECEHAIRLGRPTVITRFKQSAQAGINRIGLQDCWSCRVVSLSNQPCTVRNLEVEQGGRVMGPLGLPLVYKLKKPARPNNPDTSKPSVNASTAPMAALDQPISLSPSAPATVLSYTIGGGEDSASGEVSKRRKRSDHLDTSENPERTFDSSGESPWDSQMSACIQTLQALQQTRTEEVEAKIARLQHYYQRDKQSLRDQRDKARREREQLQVLLDQATHNNRQAAALRYHLGRLCGKSQNAMEEEETMMDLSEGDQLLIDTLQDKLEILEL